MIKVFDHPWVKNFEKKYNLSKQPTPKKEKKAKDKGPSKPSNDKALKEVETQNQSLNQQTQKQMQQEPSGVKKIKLQNDIQIKKPPTDMVLTGLMTPENNNSNLRKPLQKGSSELRLSRKSNGKEDIIKELEDYVKDKKNTTGKYLDDISEFDNVS